MKIFGHEWTFKKNSNTKNFLDAIAAVDPEVDLVDVTPAGKTDLSGYDRIGFASGSS